MDGFTHCFSLLKIKSAATEVTAQKTQTPIVAKPTPQKAYAFTPTESEFAFLSNSFYGPKEYNIPIKITLSALFSWFGINSITLLWRDYKENLVLIEHEVMGPKLTQSEGFILGVGAKMFNIAGPMIVYGVIYWITTLF